MGKSFEEWKPGDPMINERDYWQDPNYVPEDKEKENARKAALNEAMQRGNTGIDYDAIRQIVETAVRSLKDELRSELNESVVHSRQNDVSLKAMKMGSKFLFLDSDDNVYECQMVYKGKNKKKR